MRFSLNAWDCPNWIKVWLFVELKVWIVLKREFSSVHSVNYCKSTSIPCVKMNLYGGVLKYMRFELSHGVG
jgi:hypothetical protein